MRNMKFVITLGMILLTVGCNTSRFSSYDEYRPAVSSNKALVLPKDLSGSSMVNYYGIPKVEVGKSNNIVSDLPPGILFVK